MKKPKIKLDGAAIQSFFVHHVEKIVLVVVLGVMAWLVYAGYTLPGLESGKTPSGLKTVSNDTRTFIDDPLRWDRDVKVERQIEGDLVKLVTETQLDTDPTKYYLPQPLSPPNFPKLSPRLDPTLYPPTRLEVEPVVGPLASYIKSMDELDPLYQAPPEEAEPKKPAARKPPPRRTARGGGMSLDEMYGGMPAESGSPDGGASGRGRRRTSRSSAPSDADSMMATPDSMAGMGMPYGSGDMYGMGTGLAGGVNPESILGYQTSDQYTVARHTQAMVLKAVVPFEKQGEEFLNSLGSSLDYDPQRDQPWYLGYFVERAEVPANDLAADPATLTWDKIGVKAALEQQIGKAVGNAFVPGEWSGALTDIVDPSYLDPVLTHPAPPFMQRDIWRLLTHADVPLASQMNANIGADSMMFPGAKPKEGAPGSAPTDDLPVMPGVVPGSGNAYGSGEMSMPGMGSGQMPGMPGPGMGRPGAMPFPGAMGSPDSSMGMGSGGYGSGGYGSGGYGSGGYGSGGYGDGYGAGGVIAPPKYKLVRFTDTNVEQGKYYRYRVKVLLHDPNHPTYGMVAPTLASLDEKVRTRIKALDAADAAKPKLANGMAYRTAWVESDWSEPSEVVSLPSTKQYFAGSVEQPAFVEIVSGKPKVPNTQPKAKVLTNVWDPEKAVDVPAEADVFRGSILNFVQDAKVIHPVTHEVVDLEKYNFRTDAIVADLEGGDTIPPLDRKNDKPLKAPGEMLIFDAAGNLHVQNETDDIEDFRRFLLPKPDPNAAPVGADGMMPDGMDVPGGFGDLMQGPGAPGGTPARGRSGRGGSRGGP